MSDITAILTAYRRPHTVGPLVDAIRAQTVPVSQIWIWANEPSTAVVDAINQTKVDRVVTSSVNAYFHARFALALTAPTEYVAIFDDDSVSGPSWFANCLETMAHTPGILGAAGVKLAEPCYATATKHGWHVPSPHVEAVDLVGHAWFLRTEWLHYLFAAPAVLGTNGEDIELASRAWRLGGIACYCPPHPPDNRVVWGSTRGAELGGDEQAAFRHARHVAERDQIVRAEIAAGWRPLFLRNGHTASRRIPPASPTATMSENRSWLPPVPAAPVATADVVAGSSGRDARLGLIPESVQRVLIIGCGDGELGARLKERQPVCVVGIEWDAELANAARARLDRVLAGDLTTTEFDGADASFDCIVCEGFECLREPAELLRRVRAWLKPDGQFVVGVANVRHHAIVEALLDGRWPVNGNGHAAHKPLRFYTRREIEKLFYRAGFDIAERRGLPGPGYAEWGQRGRPGEVKLDRLHIGGLEADDAEEFYVDRYLIAARPAAPTGYGLTSIVIVTHNELEYTRQCVDSIRQRTDEPYERVFVDNASTDGTAEYLRTLPNSKVICNDSNRGFPAAVNQGISAATGRQVLLLNNDTIVTTGWLRRMLRALYSTSPCPLPPGERVGVRGVGLVGPCSNNVSGSQQIAVRYEGLEGLDGFAWDRGKAYDQIKSDTERLVGFCLLIRREVIDKLGPFDERFGVGCFEDDDYCWRALEAGFRVVIARDAFVHHFAGRTFVGTGVDFDGLLRSNQQVFRQKLRAAELEKMGPRYTLPPWSNGRRTDGKYALRAQSKGGLVLERPSKHVTGCIIMRDNARTIGACIESLRQCVDEIVAVDTGSTDETPQIAERLGARVFHFPWCDSFAAARNESFRYATGDWIFWVDTDDTIDPDMAVQIRRLALGPHDPAIMGYTMKVRCPSVGENGELEVTAVDQVKLIRNLPELRWERRIHEQIIPAIRRAGGEIAMTDLYVVHSGADRSPEGLKRKLERDLRLLQMEFDESPDHPFTLFNLGMTYRDAREYDKAIEYLKKCIERSGEGESHVRKAYALLVSSYSLYGRRDTAYATCQQGLRLFPKDAELRFQEGGLLSEAGRYADAVEAYRAVLQTQDEPHFASVEAGITGYLTRHNLAVVYTNIGLLQQAEEEWRRVLAEAPTFRTAWRCLGDVLVRQRKHHEAQALAERLLGDEQLRGDGFILQSQIAAACGEQAEARRKLEDAVHECPNDLDPLRALCRFLIEHAEPADAEGPLKELAARDTPDGTAYHNLGTTYLRMHEYQAAVDAYRESLQQRPDHAATLLQFGFALKECGRVDEAVTTWQRLQRAAPGDPSAQQATREIDQLRVAVA